MARVKENHKGFKVLEVSKEEVLDKLSDQGCLGICDHCARPAGNGYYIAVINRWLCEGCYREFIRTIDRYEEDKPVEDMNFERFAKLFGVDI